MKTIEKIFNAETGEETIIEHDLSSTEVQEYEAWLAFQAARKQEQIQAEAKKQALLDRLGITAEEAKLLLS